MPHLPLSTTFTTSLNAHAPLSPPHADINTPILQMRLLRHILSALAINIAMAQLECGRARKAKPGKCDLKVCKSLSSVLETKRYIRIKRLCCGGLFLSAVTQKSQDSRFLFGLHHEDKRRIFPTVCENANQSCVISHSKSHRLSFLSSINWEELRPRFGPTLKAQRGRAAVCFAVSP